MSYRNIIFLHIGCFINEGGMNWNFTKLCMKFMNPVKFGKKYNEATSTLEKN